MNGERSTVNGTWTDVIQSEVDVILSEADVILSEAKDRPACEPIPSLRSGQALLPFRPQDDGLPAPVHSSLFTLHSSPQSRNDPLDQTSQFIPYGVGRFHHFLVVERRG